MKQEMTRAIVRNNGAVTVVFPVIYATSAHVARNSTVIAKYKSVVALVL